MIAAGLVLALLGAGLAGLGLLRGTTPASAPAPVTRTNPDTDPIPAEPEPAPGICAVGDPSHRNEHPNDGRLHGGGLAVAVPADWEQTDPGHLAFGFDVAYAQAVGEAPGGWAALGAIRIEEPYSTPEQASATITSCLRQVVPGATVKVTGEGTSEVRGAARAHERIGTLSVAGRTQDFRVVVADLHSPESLAFYVRAVDPGTPDAEQLIKAEADLGAD